MATRISWIHPVRIAQVLFGVAVFGLIIYILTAYQFDNVTKYMLFNGIWTGFVVTPYLALAPVHFHKFSYRLVIPTLETSTFILWLVAVILFGISLPSPGICDKDAGCEAAQAVVVLAALECALFLVTAIRGLVNSVRAHVHHTTGAQAEPAPEASGAMQSV